MNMQGTPKEVTLFTDDLNAIIQLLRDAGELMSDEDAVYHDEELEFLVPALARVFLKYAKTGTMFHTQPMAMIQIFDVITRFVEDPDLLPPVNLQELKS
jgi:DNA-binding PucR family transcriptional regulator